METKPEISVILSTYNRAKKYLPRAIKSVLNQTFKDFELIIIDDGSTDNTVKVVSSFKDKRIRYYKIPHFGCDTRAKNIGIKRSRADLIAFLDDDNYFRPDHLQALYNCLKRNEEITLAYGDRWVHWENGKNKDQIGIYSDFDSAKLMVRNYIDTSDVLVRKEALIKVGGFDEKLKKFIDWNLWVRLMKRGYIFKRVAVILTDYTIHEQMKSTKVKEGQFNPETGLFTPTFDPMNCEINVGFLGSKRPLKVAIFTLTKDRLALTKKSFESLRKTAGYPFDHFIVDQGSKDGTIEWLKEKEKEGWFKKVIYNSKNMGIPYASNQVIEEIKKRNYDIVGKVDNDCYFKTFNWLESMINIYKVMHKIALSTYIEGLIDNAGGVTRSGYGFLANEFLGYVIHIGGICSFVPIEVYDEFKWPNTAFLHGGNDVLLSSYLNQNGYLLAYMENHRAEHLESTLGQIEKYPKYFEKRTRETLTRTADYLKTGKLSRKGKLIRKSVKEII